jgi:hypothetical protein
MADRDSDSDHSDRVAAGRIARVMQPRAKLVARDRANGRPGESPGRLALEPKKSRSRERREGWDERFMVALAVVLALIVAAAAVYQTIAWARI